MCVDVKSECCYTLLVFTPGSLAMTPVPEHGASSRTLSNPPITCRQHFQHVSTVKIKFYIVNINHRITVFLRMYERYLRELPSVVVADDTVGDPQTVDVAHHALQSLGVGVISHDHTCVPHQLS